MPGAVFLATDRIELRTVESENLEWINGCRNDPRIWQSMLTHTPRSLDRTKQTHGDDGRSDRFHLTAGSLECDLRFGLSHNTPTADSGC